MDLFGIGAAIQKAINDAIDGAITGLASGAWDMLGGAFANEKIDENWWKVVRGDGTGGMVMAWIQVMAPIIVILMILQIARAALQRNKNAMMQGAVGGIMGIPASFLAVYLVEKLSLAFDGVTGYILGRLNQGDGAAAFMKMFGYIKNADGKFQRINEFWLFTGQDPTAPYWGALLLFVICWLFSLILLGMMIFRNFTLTLMTTLAPVAIGTMPLSAMKGWAIKWGEMTTGLLIAKPLSAGVLAFSMTLFSGFQGPSQTIAGLMGILIAAAMPLLTMSFISFTSTSASSGVDNAGKQFGSSVGRNVTRISRLRLGRRSA